MNFVVRQFVHREFSVPAHCVILVELYFSWCPNSKILRQQFSRTSTHNLNDSIFMATIISSITTAFFSLNWNVLWLISCPLQKYLLSIWWAIMFKCHFNCHRYVCSHQTCFIFSFSTQSFNARCAVPIWTKAARLGYAFSDLVHLA